MAPRETSMSPMDCSRFRASSAADSTSLRETSPESRINAFSSDSETFMRYASIVAPCKYAQARSREAGVDFLRYFRYTGFILKRPRRGRFLLGKRATYTIHMLDLKTINSVLGEFEDRGITKETMVDAIEAAMATAYKKEYGKRGQVVRAKLDMNTGTISFEQVKTVVDETLVRFPEEGEDELSEPEHRERLREEETPEGELPRFDPEKHILLADARRIKRDAAVGGELGFPP